MLGAGQVGASEYEHGKRVNGPVAVQLCGSAEYVVSFETAGYASVQLSLGEVPRSTVRAPDFLFLGWFVLLRIMMDGMMTVWHRVARPRNIRLRPIASGPPGGRSIAVAVSLSSTHGETTLSLKPAEPVEVRIVRTA